MLITALLAFVGCSPSGPDDLTGEDLYLDGSPAANEEPSFTLDPTLSGPDSFGEQDCAQDTGGSPTLSVEGGKGEILVSHSFTGDCGETTVSGSISASQIDVVYTNDTADTAYCACPVLLVYTIGNLSAGNWTVSALDDQATATVR